MSNENHMIIMKNEIWDKAWSNIARKVGNKVRYEIKTNIWHKIGDKVWIEAKAKIENKLDDRT